MDKLILLEREFEALKIQAMMQGIDVDTYIKKSYSVEEYEVVNRVTLSTEEFAACKIAAAVGEISVDEYILNTYGTDEYDVSEPKKKKRSKSTADKKIKESNLNVAELGEFAKFKRNLMISICCKEHEIPYKEQLWGIDEREILFNVEFQKNKMVCKRVCEMFNGDTDRAMSGEDRYIIVNNHDENIPKELKEICYIQLRAVDGKIKAKTITIPDKLKKCHVDIDKLNIDLGKAMRKLMASNE